MTYMVDINSIHKQFERAHGQVIQSLGGPQKIRHAEEGHHQLMMRAWLKQHGVQILRRSGQWTHLRFPSEKHYALWLMRWS